MWDRECKGDKKGAGVAPQQLQFVFPRTHWWSLFGEWYYISLSRYLFSPHILFPHSLLSSSPPISHLPSVPISINLHGIAVLSPAWMCSTFSSIFHSRHRWAKSLGYDELGHIWKYPESDANIPQLLALAESFFLEYQMMNIQQYEAIVWYFSFNI